MLLNRFSQLLTLATLASALWSATLTVQAQAPTRPGPHDAILTYQGADREAWLLERAQRRLGHALHLDGTDRGRALAQGV